MSKHKAPPLNVKPIPFHPSYGYATPEQMEKIQTLGMGPERDYLLRRIQRQQERRGVRE